MSNAWQEWFSLGENLSVVAVGGDINAVPADAWVSFGLSLSAMESDLVWYWADLLVKASDRDKYIKAQKIEEHEVFPTLMLMILSNSERAEGTVRNWMTTARNWDKERRILPISYHMLLNGKPQKEQDEMIERVQREGWTTGQLREYLYPSNGSTSGNTGRVETDEEAQQRLQQENEALRQHNEILSKRVQENQSPGATGGWDSPNDGWDELWGESEGDDRTPEEKATEWIRKHAPPYVKSVWERMCMYQASEAFS